MTASSGTLSGYLLSERYEALIRVSQAIGAHREPKDLFRAMATELHRVMQFDGIVVAQYDEASNEILWNACEVCSQQGPISLPDIPADETITKWVYQRQEPIWDSASSSFMTTPRPGKWTISPAACSLFSRTQRFQRRGKYFAGRLHLVAQFFLTDPRHQRIFLMEIRNSADDQ